MLIEKISELSDKELKEMGRAAQIERDRLLDQYPSLKEFQKEIDRCMRMAGDSENRMKVLAIMIEAKLIELRDQFSKLLLLV